MMEGIGFYCGIVMRWFRDAFCELEAAEARQTGEDVYAVMERKAARVPPGSNGISGIFSNLMQADRWVHASPAFVGFDVANPARAGRVECFRAIEESAAYVTRGHLQIIEELTGIEAKEAVLTGGAAKGILWPQILADVLGLPIRIPVVKESTAFGAAICAGVGAGLYEDAGSTATRLVEFERTVYPDPEAAAAYRGLYERWPALYAGLLQLSEAGLVRPMWRAAGA
jgi:autoinducer 2 (AI-2) kinase